MRIAIPDNYPVFYSEQDPLLQALREQGEVVVCSTHHRSVLEELIARMRGAEAVINVRAYTNFSEPVFAALPELRFVTVMGTGTDNVDLAAAYRHGVLVSNTPSAPTVSVAEYTIGLMLAIARNIVPMHRELQLGTWRHRRGIELRGKTFGFVGLGRIAEEMAPIVRSLGMRIVGWSLSRDETRARRLGVELLELDDLMRAADVVSLLLRDSPRTRGIIGARELALMRPTAYLVNTGRGSLVDEGALYSALREGRLAGAALDVFREEPLPPDSPLLGLENTICTPHAAWATDEGAARMAKDPVENVLAYLSGAPRNLVYPETAT